MARFMVKASEYKNVCKAVNDRKLAELKKEIIEILKKQDENEVKKAVDYFNSQELHYTHLEKSFNGKWIEKAGYGVGTVRIWKGKKYKKIAPGKWARVFEKEGRGTNIAIGKLIAKVQKIDNVEDLMAFVMQNKQRFVDENGVDLPVLDKLRAAVDSRNGNVGSKTVSKPSEKKSPEKLLKEMGFETMEKVSYNGDKWKVAGVSLDSDGNAVGVNLTPDRQSGNLKSSNVTVDDIGKIKKEKLGEKKEDLEAALKEVEDAIDNAGDYDDIEELENERQKLLKEIGDKGEKKTGKTEKVELGTFTKIDDKTVEMPSDKVSKQLFENLNKSRSGDNTRPFMTDCYYDGENIVSTDGLRMTVIKAENIGLEPGYVSVKTDGGKIRLESIEKKDLRTSFPNYKGVMPTKNNQEVKFDNKALTEKLKEMKKEGKYTKAEPQIALEFEDGKVMLDGVQIGSADGVKFDSNDQRMVINANFLKDALTSGDISSMFVSDNPNKAMVIRTDVSDSVVMPYRNEIKTEYEVHPNKTGSDTESKPDIKSMSNDELKEYEAKLEKELLELGNRNSPDYMKKYSEWREVHGENNDRFHQAIEDEARAEKQKEADAKAEKEKEIKEKYNGYFDSRSGLDKARDVKLLEKKYNFDGKVMSQKDFVEQAIDGGAEIKEREVNKLEYPSRTRWNRMNGYEQEQYERRIKEAGKKTLYSINGFEFPKSVVDYAKYYKENGKKGSSNEKSSLSDVGIKNKASSIASAVSYSKDYQKKMGVPFNLETAEVSVDDADDMDEATKKAVKEELRRIYDDKKVKKSLFDDFIIDVFEADEDEEIEDAIKADETEYNDYSAEQPELFNSVEFAVREALNRRHNCIM